MSSALVEYGFGTLPVITWEPLSCPSSLPILLGETRITPRSTSRRPRLCTRSRRARMVLSRTCKRTPVRGPMTCRLPRFLFSLLALASAVQLPAQTSGFKVIQPSGADTAYSAGILANGTLYVSGQGSSAKDLTSQASEAMHKVQTVLRGAGMDFENVVWMNVYLTDD